MRLQRAASPPPKVNGHRQPKKRAAVSVIRPTELPDAVPPVEFAKFGEFVVLKKADVVALLQTMQRWSSMVEAML